jgi:hypothetical protein
MTVIFTLLLMSKIIILYRSKKVHFYEMIKILNILWKNNGTGCSFFLILKEKILSSVHYEISYSSFYLMYYILRSINQNLIIFFSWQICHLLFLYLWIVKVCYINFFLDRRVHTAYKQSCIPLFYSHYSSYLCSMLYDMKQNSIAMKNCLFHIQQLLIIYVCV